MKHKSITTLSLLALACHSLQAAPLAWINEHRHGFYLAAGISENFFHFHTNFTFDPNVVNRTSYYDRGVNYDTVKMSPDLTVGYGQYSNDYYLGAELGLNLSEMRRTDTNSNGYRAHYTLKNTLAARAKAGYLVQPNTLAYVLVGATEVNFNEQLNFTRAGAFRRLRLTPAKLHKNLWGAVVGIGIERPLNEHFHVGVEYQHVFYNDIKFRLTQPTFKFLGPLGKAKLDLNQNSLFLKLTYYS